MNSPKPPAVTDASVGWNNQKSDIEDRPMNYQNSGYAEVDTSAQNIAADSLKGEAALKALERFVIDNPELEKLEAMLSQFNLFEAIGVVRMEVRHSDFLSFLLDPSQNKVDPIV